MKNPFATVTYRIVTEDGSVIQVISPDESDNKTLLQSIRRFNNAIKQNALGGGGIEIEPLYYDLLNDDSFTRSLQGAATLSNGILTLDGDTPTDSLVIDDDPRLNPGDGDWSISMDLKRIVYNLSYKHHDRLIWSKFDQYNSNNFVEGLAVQYINGVVQDGGDGFSDYDYAYVRLNNRSVDDTTSYILHDYSNINAGDGKQITLITAWHKLTCVFDQAQGEMRIYKNGVLVATDPGYIAPQQVDSPLEIGAHSYWQNNAFGEYGWTGQITNIHVANKAWTEAEIALLPTIVT